MQVTIAEAMRIGAEHHQAGRLAEAENVYRMVLAREPENADALQLLGVLLTQRGMREAGVALLERAVGINPSAGILTNLANAYWEVGRLDESISASRRALGLNASIAEAHNILGNALRSKGDVEGAIAECRQAVVLKPALAEAHLNLACVLAMKGKTEESFAEHREALRLRPNYPEAHNNLGTLLADAGRLDEAVAALREAIHIRPDYAEAFSNLGLVLCMMGKLEESLVMCRRAVVLAPKNAEYHWNLALDLLVQGHFREGWGEFEWRWRMKEFTSLRRKFPQMPWRGEELNGRTIVLHAEQGLGDAIQFVRYVPMVQQRGGNVIVQCGRELVELFEANLPGVRVVARDDEPPNYDVHCPLMSLPPAFRTELAGIPAAVPYLTANAERSLEWEKRVGPAAGKLRVGLVWAGSPGHKKDWQRTIELAKFAPLGAVEGVKFFSLQKGPAGEQVKSAAALMRIDDFTAGLKNFSDTAALIANLDLVIGVDTAVVHLAGAMGKPAWLLLPLAPDWRWLLGREDSPWYPTVRLFRQKRFGDWDEVIARVAAALQEGKAGGGLSP